MPEAGTVLGMRLTQHTDYGLRILLYLGLKNGQATSLELATNFKMSRHHVAKLIHRLGKKRWIETSKGKGGGVKLAALATQLSVAEVVQGLEPDFYLVECFNQTKNRCPIAGACRLESLLYSAHSAFVETLKTTTLGELIQRSPRDPRLKKLRINT